ncbi:MAG: hypothetical protein KF724_10405 [Phycisphaeraceae bacterium]|nr:hypothetical protein [Phycisphaeraceae bacterium]
MTPRRVLHVITPSAPAAGEAMLRLLGFTRRLLPELDHQVLVVGAFALSRRAVAAGVGGHRRLPPLLGAPRLSARGIRNAVEQAGADLIHLWDHASADLVVDGRPAAGVVATLAGTPVRGAATPLAQDRAEAICLGERARRQALDAGWLHGRVRTVSPPVDSQFNSGAHGREVTRAAWRDSWGIDEATVAVGVLGDPWTSIDAKLAFDMAGRAALAGHRVKLVIDPRAAAAGELRRWGDLTSLRHVFVEEPAAARPWTIVHALDAALVVEQRPISPKRWCLLAKPRGAPSGPLSALWAVDAGLPLVATTGGVVEGLVPPERVVQVRRQANAGAAALCGLLPRADCAAASTPALQRTTEDDPAPPQRRATAESWAREIRALYERV